jgi:predicted house-cleaning noncanonical NTP pyrophosphatase (MazG superfamily)
MLVAASSLNRAFAGEASWDLDPPRGCRHDARMLEKLVRDRIDQIMADAGVPARTRLANEGEFPSLLFAKLREECSELTSAPSIDELADVLEVAHAVADWMGTPWSEVEELRRRKQVERGAFVRRLVLQLE